MERIPLLDEDETAKMVGTIEMISRPKIPYEQEPDHLHL